MTITRETMKVLRAEINAALEEVAKRNNVSLAVGAGSFESSAASFKLNITAHTESGEKVDLAAQNLRIYGHLYGVQPSMEGKTFEYRNQTFTLVGIEPSRPKRPIVATCGGKRYVFTTEVLLRMKKEAA